jgi:hypothetical protein
MIGEVLVLTISIFIMILLVTVQESYGQSIIDIFFPATSDDDRKQEIYKIVEPQVYHFELNDIFGIYEELDVIELTDSIFEQEKLEGTEYTESGIKLKVNNASISLLLKSKDEFAGRGNIK